MDNQPENHCRIGCLLVNTSRWARFAHPLGCIRVSYGYSRERANMIVVSFIIHKYISVSRAMKVQTLQV